MNISPEILEDMRKDAEFIENILDTPMQLILLSQIVLLSVEATNPEKMLKDMFLFGAMAYREWLRNMKNVDVLKLEERIKDEQE